MANTNPYFPDNNLLESAYKRSYYKYAAVVNVDNTSYLIDGCLVKIIEEKGGSIFSIKDINEKCHMCGIPCFYIFFSFSIPILNFCELEKEFKRIPYYVVSKPLHAY